MQKISFFFLHTLQLFSCSQVDPLNASTINYKTRIACFTNSLIAHKALIGAASEITVNSKDQHMEVMKQKCVHSELSCCACACARIPPPPIALDEKGRGTETPPRGRAWYCSQREDHVKKTFMWEEDFLIHSSGHQMVLQRHAWFTFRDEDEAMRKAEGHSHRGHHHNSRAKWMMATINVPREKRGYYKCCGGELCFFTLQIGALKEQSSLLINGKNVPALQTAPVVFIYSNPKENNSICSVWIN